MPFDGPKTPLALEGPEVLIMVPVLPDHVDPLGTPLRGLSTTALAPNVSTFSKVVQAILP